MRLVLPLIQKRQQGVSAAASAAVWAKPAARVIKVSGQEAAAESVSELLLESGILSKIEPYGVKILGNGELTKKLTVKANKFSSSAVEKIEKIGGKVEVL